MKVCKGSQRIEVKAFLILERIADSKDFLISVLLQSDGRFIAKSSLGTVAEGQEIWLSLRWDQPEERFVASSQEAGSVPILSFIPFALPGACRLPFPPDSPWRESFLLNSARNNAAHAHENKN